MTMLSASTSLPSMTTQALIRFIVCAAALAVQENHVVAQLPPTEWVKQQQETKCDNLVPASITIVNDSKTRFDVFWMNKQSNSLQKINSEPLEYRQVIPFNSYVNQYMELHELPNQDTGECGGADNNNNVCRRAFVQLTSDVKSENVVRINPRFEAITETNALRARAYLGEKIESSIRINNRSGSSLDLYWVDHKGGKVKLITLQDNTDQNFGSVVNNEFEAQELATEYGPCASSPTGCRTARFKYHGGDEPVTITADFEPMMGGDNISED